MTTTTTGPFAVALTTQLSLTAPGQSGSTYYDRVIIANASPFVANANAAGAFSFVQPFTADVMDVPPSGNPIAVTFSQAPGGSGTAPSASYLTATWLQPTDDVNASYPAQLPTSAVVVVGTVTTQDAADGTPGQPVPAMAVYMAGDAEGTLTPIEVDASGNVGVFGTITADIQGHAGAQLDAATGATAPTSALLVGGSDGATLRALPVVVAGGPDPANVLYVGGSDGSNARALATDGTGQVKVLVENTVTIANGASVDILSSANTPLDATPTTAVPGRALYIGGSDGTNLQAIKLDTSGRLILGAPAANLPTNINGHGGASLDAAPGTALPTNGLLVGGSDGTNLRAVPVQLTGSGVVSTAVQVGGTDGTNLRLLATDNTGHLILGGGTASIGVANIEGHAGGIVDAVLGAAIPANALQVGGSDGTDLRALSVDSSGRIILGAPSANLPISIAAQTLAAVDDNLKNVGGNAVVTAANGVLRVGIAGSANNSLDSSTAGVVDENLRLVGNSAVSTAAAGVQKVGIVGATGTTLDAATAGVLDQNLKNIGNTAVSTNTGAVGAGTQRMTQGSIGLSVANIDATVAANATSNVISAVGGKTVTVYGYQLTVAPAAVTLGSYVGKLRGTTTTTTVVGAARLRMLTAVGLGVADLGPLWIPGGFAMPIGEGVDFFADNGNAASIDVAGVIYYTQV